MKVKLSKEFIEVYKKANVRIRHAVDIKLQIFLRNHLDTSLHTHSLREPYQGKNSITITADWRAIYEEIEEDPEEPTAYFITLGTHNQLYKKK